MVGIHIDESLVSRPRNYANEKTPTGKNILDALKARGMTRAEFARLAGITEASISRYITGKQEPRAAELHRMARALGLSMERLLMGEDLPIGNEIEANRGLVMREDPLPYGVKPGKELDRVRRRLEEVIEELEQIKRDISENRN